MAGAVDVAMLVVGRIFLGFGVGLCSLVRLVSFLHLFVWCLIWCRVSSSSLVCHCIVNTPCLS